MDDTSIEEGRAMAEAIGQRHGVPAHVVATLLTALRRGGGRQAQFSHPALGGMGQWSRGGGIMIGDMFNHSLKAKVEQLCNELAEHVDKDRLFAHQPPGSSHDWWPQDLGRLSAVGSQNEQGYACFPEARRLAIRGADGVQLYDTGDHRISGVSQQQGTSCDLSFTSQHGTVRLHDLKQVEGRLSGGETGLDARELADDSEPGRHRPQPPRPSPGMTHDILATIERLHELQRKGILTAEEFAAKKTELLARL